MKCTKVNNEQKKAWIKNLKEILFEEKQSIDANKSEHPTGTLYTTLHKPAGEANPYDRFGYGPQKIY